MNRRAFLRNLTQFGLASALPFGCNGGEEVPFNPLAQGGDWGKTPAEFANVALPANRVHPVFEHFMLGGINPFDTFYVVPEYGKPSPSGGDGRMWWTFQDGPNSVGHHFDRCGGGGRPLLKPFTTDSLGQTVNLGPWLYPLHDRPDILARTRLVVLSHLLEPHSVAVPLALTGRAQASGRNLVSTGAHVQRFFAENAANAGVVPRSWVLVADEMRPNMGSAAVAAKVGRHPGWAQPITVHLAPGREFQNLLARPEVASNRAAFDHLSGLYLTRYRQHLEAQRAAPSDAQAIAQMEYVRRVMERHVELNEAIPPDLVVMEAGQACDIQVGYDPTRIGIRSGRRLLSEGQPGKYVVFLDSGIVSVPRFGVYDSHVQHVECSSQAIVNACSRLSASINTPGENNPAKFDLDRNTIVLTSEFGRSPYPTDDGLDHWPLGYVVALIGGAIGPEQAGVAGALDENAMAVNGFTPTEFRAAMLMMMGIWPFYDEAYRVSDVRGATDELSAALRLRTELLGIPA